MSCFRRSRTYISEACMSALPAAADPTLSAQYLERVDAYWRAANYLSVGQIYLLDNPLLSESLKIGQVKPRRRACYWPSQNSHASKRGPQSADVVRSRSDFPECATA